MQQVITRAALGAAGLVGGGLVAGGFRHAQEEEGLEQLVPSAIGTASAAGLVGVAAKFGSAGLPGRIALGAGAAAGMLLLGGVGRSAIHGVHMLAGGAGGHEHGSHGAHVVPRTAPEDRVLAQQVFDATIESFGDVQRSDMQPAEKGNHLRLTDEQRATFAAEHPGTPIPNSVMFDAETDAPIAVVYSGRTAAPDLGLGPSHQHGEATRFMQHVWFTPDNLDLAFSDVAGKRVARTIANDR